MQTVFDIVKCKTFSNCVACPVLCCELPHTLFTSQCAAHIGHVCILQCLPATQLLVTASGLRSEDTRLSCWHVVHRLLITTVCQLSMRSFIACFAADRSRIRVRTHSYLLCCSHVEDQDLNPQLLAFAAHRLRLSQLRRTTLVALTQMRRQMPTGSCKTSKSRLQLLKHSWAHDFSYFYLLEHSASLPQVPEGRVRGEETTGI